jgi:hypothetical protein
MSDSETCGWAGAGRQGCWMTHADVTGHLGSVVELGGEGAERRGE